MTRDLVLKYADAVFGHISVLLTGVLSMVLFGTELSVEYGGDDERPRGRLPVQATRDPKHARAISVVADGAVDGAPATSSVVTLGMTGNVRGPVLLNAQDLEQTRRWSTEYAVAATPRRRARRQQAPRDHELFISASNSTKSAAASSDSGSVVDRKDGAS